MRPEGCAIHFGVNFVFAPAPAIDKQRCLAFQQGLVNCGVDFSSVSHDKQKIEVICRKPVPLQVTVKLAGPQVGQLLIVAPNPGYGNDMFAKHAVAVCKAFDSVWPGQRQIILRDATNRYLYDTTDPQHAFQELWSTRLKQPVETLKHFGKPVLGGGLRFVMPPHPSDTEPVAIEVKIESFLQDARKFFVEVQMTWPNPMPPEKQFDPEHLLSEVSGYIDNSVLPFITEK